MAFKYYDFIKRLKYFHRYSLLPLFFQDFKVMLMYYQSKQLQQFNNHVGLKFQLYNSLFTSLPFHRIEKTGILLSLLVNHCEEGFQKHQSPIHIIDDFFARYVPLKNEKEQTNVLFRFVQYAESSNASNSTTCRSAYCTNRNNTFVCSFSFFKGTYRAKKSSIICMGL